MASFGGSIKLTGADEYKNSLRQITQSLRETGSELTAIASKYDKNDSSLSTLKAKTTEMTSVLNKQQQAYATLKSAYDSFSAKVTQQVQAHEKLSQTYEKEKKELENIRKASGESSQAFQDQQAKVNELANAFAKSSQNIADNEIALSKMKTQLNQAEASMNTTKKNIEGLGDATEESGEKAKKGGDGYTVFKNVLANLTTQGINLAISAVKELGQAIINVGKQALSSYADYEQLVGGVETLFKDSASVVEGYANEAYKTAGLSANQYMETVTSFSASMLQSLGNDTKKSAEMSNQAIIDMSDNANKMGTDMTMIQNAYQGFAKQNYTMLDNLKLGYGGTKTEMQRLIADANKVKEANGEMANLSINSFADITEAIHIIQTEMGITGTTAKEASETISGSVNSMKSAWSNLLTGIADDNADLSDLMGKLVDSIGTALKNILPRVQQILVGMTSMFGEYIPKMLKELSSQIKDQISPMANQAVKLVASIVNAILSSLPMIITAGAELINGLLTGLGEAIPTILNTVIEIVPQIVSSLISAIPVLINGAVQFFLAIVKAIPTVITNLVKAIPLIVDAVISGLLKAIPQVVEGALQLLMGIVEAIPELIPIIVKTLPEVIFTIVKVLIKNIPLLLETGVLIIKTLIEGIVSMIGNLGGKAKEVGKTFLDNAITFFKEFPSKVWEWLINTLAKIGEWGLNLKDKAIEIGSNFIQNVITFFQELPEKIGFLLGQAIGYIIKFGIDAWNWVTTKVPEIIQGIVTFFQELPDKIKEWLYNTLVKVGEWAISMKDKAVETGKNFINNLITFIKELPSKIGAFLVETINKVIQWGRDLVAKGKQASIDLVNNIVNTVRELPSKMLEIGRNIVQGIWNGINNAKDWVLNKIKGFGKSILNGIKSVFGIHSPSTVFRDQIGKNLALGIGEGFEDEMKDVTNEMQSAIPSSFDTNLNVGSNSASASNSFNSMVEAFKEALSEMAVELDDEKVGRFVETTVTNAIYN